MDAPSAADELTGMLAMCFDAGITRDEISFHPEHGLMLSLGAVEKLTKLAPDKDRARRLVETLKVHFEKPAGTA